MWMSGHPLTVRTVDSINALQAFPPTTQVDSEYMTGQITEAGAARLETRTFAK